MASNDRLSKVVRRQLHELRIDADETHTPRPPILSRVRAWCGEHKEEVILIGGTAAVLIVIIGSVALMASSSGSVSAPGGGAQSASVSLGNVTVQVVPPAYRRLSAIEAVVFVHVDLRNTSATLAELRAGDIVLADPHGAVFAPTWLEANGNSVDGFAQPDHALLALAPGAEVQIDLKFLVLSNGPFSLHYERRVDETRRQPLLVGLDQSQ